MVKPPIRFTRNPHGQRRAVPEAKDVLGLKALLQELDSLPLTWEPCYGALICVPSHRLTRENGHL